MEEQVKKMEGVVPGKEREGPRKAAGIPFSGAGTSAPGPGDPEVAERASRRKFTARYKLRSPGGSRSL